MKPNASYYLLIFIFLIVTDNLGAQILESALNKGDVYKIAVNQNGVHKISRDQLATLKIDIDNVDPRTIKIFGGRGGMLNESNATPRPDDVQELSIEFIGENDGKIDKDDHILFYAEGPNQLQYADGKYSLVSNIYDNQNYYFIKIDPAKGKRVQKDEKVYQPTIVLEEYEAIERYEKDITNLLGAYHATEGAGKDWYGEIFKTQRELKLTDKFTLSNAVQGSPINIEMVFAARSAANSNVQLSFGGQTFSKSISNVDPDDNEGSYAQRTKLSDVLTSYTGLNNIVITYPSTAIESEGWLDYLQLVYKRKAKFNNQQFNFRSSQNLEATACAIKIEDVSKNLKVWDVTDPFNVLNKKIENNQIAYASNGSLREFCAHKASEESLSPTLIGKISNQNIHGLLTEDVIILYHPSFATDASRLASHRSKISNLEVATIDVTQVYNEFSSGKVDPTAIRDMARMMYKRNKSFKYLVLFGDGSYDYKGLVKDINPENFIPVYETDESLNPISGFPSDDYYGLLDDNEGINLVGDMDIYVGRLPAKTPEEAKILVDKIIHYETSPSVYGDWRLKIGYNADDQDYNTHVRDMDVIANTDEQRHPAYNQQKVYFDAYTQVSTSGEHRFPDANKSLNSNIINGQLSTVYLGHGGPLGWAQERVLTVPDIVSWDNYDAMTVMLTATCSFAAYDDPSILTPAEQAILNPKGGAIALFSTTRSVYTNSNMELTNAVSDLLYKKVDGQAPTLGYCLAEGKNKYTGSSFRVNSRKFTLLGDPSMPIALPKNNITITKVNNKSAAVGDTVSALELVSIEGNITDVDGKIIEDFDGYIYPTVFDKKSKLQTLAQDTDSQNFPYTAYRNTLFKGKSTVENGKWKFEFYVPKNISYSIGSGRISLYATNHLDNDAEGYYNGLKIGGSSNSSVVDNVGPEIKAYMDSRSFENGDETQTTAKLILDLSDDLGINVTGSSIGQDITAILDDDKSNLIVLNNYYSTVANNYKEGIVEYSLSNLSPGSHTLTAKAWDISGNSTETTINFEVVDGLLVNIKDVLVFPNPFSKSTTVKFNAPNTSTRAELAVYDVTGRLIEKQDVITSGGKVNTFTILEDQNLNTQNLILTIISRDANNKVVGKSDGIKLMAVN